jgi:hypothetical protein
VEIKLKSSHGNRNFETAGSNEDLTAAGAAVAQSSQGARISS